MELEFRFADGAVVTDAWDGRSPWRAYRFLRAAPLVSARVDPQGTIAIDPDELNDARRVEPKAGFASRLGELVRGAGRVGRGGVDAMALRRGAGSASHGTLRVTLARFALVVLCALPAWLLMRGALSGGPAANPYFVDGAGPLPWLFVARMVMQVGAAWAGGLAAGLLAALILDQLLLAGAVRVLSPRRGPWDRPRLLPAIFRGGRRTSGRCCAWRSSRCSRGAAAWRRCAGCRGDCTRPASAPAGGPTRSTSSIPLAVLLAGLLWLALVAAFALWTRVIVVADGRRRVRRAAAVALGVFRRRPGRALAGPAAALLLAALLPGIALAWWRGSEPLGGVAVALFTLLALAAFAAQAWIWARLVAAAVARYAQPEMDGPRYAPDTPFGTFRALSRGARGAGAWRRAERPAGPGAVAAAAGSCAVSVASTVRLVSTREPPGVPPVPAAATLCALVVVATCESGIPSAGESRSVDSVA